MANDRLEALAETKLLTYNLSKCFVIVLGERKARTKLLDDFEDNTPTLYGKKMQIVKSETYLSNKLGIGASESVNLTIKKRTGLVK